PSRSFRFQYVLSLLSVSLALSLFPSPLLSSCLRPPPLPPLFPYTTLFRSRAARLALAISVHLPPGPGAGNKAAVRRGIEAGFHTDRKSTRLNSSHEWISYAVFCLKKKKERSNERNSA